MIKEAILKVYKHQDLTYDEAYQTMDEIMSGEATEVQMSAYLTAMSMKGETIEEITASAEAMRAHCLRLLNDETVLEIVGTGGDGSNTFNISTTSSIVISAAGGRNREDFGGSRVKQDRRRRGKRGARRQNIVYN